MLTLPRSLHLRENGSRGETRRSHCRSCLVIRIFAHANTWRLLPCTSTGSGADKAVGAEAQVPSYAQGQKEPAESRATRVQFC